MHTRALKFALIWLAWASPGGAASLSCEPKEGLQFICGPVASEDLVRFLETPFLIASGLNVGAPANLYWIDSRSASAERIDIFLGAAPVASSRRLDFCSDTPDPDRWSLSGLAIEPIGPNRVRLFAANHGDRFAIEIFEVTVTQGKPTATWMDCVNMPVGTLPNAVAPLPDGSLLITSFYDPRERNPWARMERGFPTGALWRWYPTQGFREEISGLSGANGVAADAEANIFYVSDWGRGELVVLNKNTDRMRRYRLGFLPDNIKLAPNGMLWIAGQVTRPINVGRCTGPECPQPWVVARVNPGNGRVLARFDALGSREINYATTAFELNGRLFINARGDNRLAVIAVKDIEAVKKNERPKR